MLLLVVGGIGVVVGCCGCCRGCWESTPFGSAKTDAREREKEKKNATEQNSISSKAHADMQVREEEVVDYLDASGRKEGRNLIQF